MIVLGQKQENDVGARVFRKVIVGYSPGRNQGGEGEQRRRVYDHMRLIYMSMRVPYI